MRDPKRIPGVLEAVRQAWEKSPDLRLGQLIENLAVMAGHRDAFNIEDDKLKAQAEQLAIELEK